MDRVKMKHLYQKLKHASEEQKCEAMEILEEILDKVGERYPEYYRKYAMKFNAIFEGDEHFRSYQHHDYPERGHYEGHFRGGYNTTMPYDYSPRWGERMEGRYDTEDRRSPYNPYRGVGWR